MPDTCLEMTSHFREIPGDSPICRHSRNIDTNYEHNYEVAFWDLYEEFLFSNILFCVTIVFDCITHRFVVIHPYTKVHTPRSIHQATSEDSNVHTPAYFYIEKTPNVHFLVYLYKKKPFRALKHTNT